VRLHKEAFVLSTKFGVFSLSQFPDQSKRVEGFDDDLAQFELAEELGYDSVWLAEHLFSTYGVVASSQLLAAAVARRTKRVRIGSGISVIPFNHPLRTAADFAAVDCFSHGRLNFGVGRAYQPHEFIGLGIDMAHSREMLDEGMELITKAWTQPTFTHDGAFWKVPIELEALPKPVQQPHPPIYFAAVTPPSFAYAAERGWNLQMASPFSYRIYRENWIDAQSAQVDEYFEKARSFGFVPEGLERVLMIPFYVAETDEQAMSEFAPYVEWFYHKVSSHERLAGKERNTVAGYEMAMVEGRKTAELGMLRFAALYENKAVAVGSPETVIELLRELKARLRVTEFILWTNLGGIPNEYAQRSMRLAAEKVMPHV
jgi:alkanesulfonate monooxygenase SsuD/methylene tetrahydromethanopterin reductase-like flavin-dependent oxidoreductase (luciferase family)